MTGINVITVGSEQERDITLIDFIDLIERGECDNSAVYVVYGSDVASFRPVSMSLGDKAKPPLVIWAAPHNATGRVMDAIKKGHLHPFGVLGTPPVDYDTSLASAIAVSREFLQQISGSSSAKKPASGNGDSPKDAPPGEKEITGEGTIEIAEAEIIGIDAGIENVREEAVVEEMPYEAAGNLDVQTFSVVNGGQRGELISASPQPEVERIALEVPRPPKITRVVLTGTTTLAVTLEGSQGTTNLAVYLSDTQTRPPRPTFITNVAVPGTTPVTVPVPTVESQTAVYVWLQPYPLGSIYEVSSALTVLPLPKRPRVRFLKPQCQPQVVTGTSITITWGMQNLGDAVRVSGWLSDGMMTYSANTTLPTSEKGELVWELEGRAPGKYTFALSAQPEGGAVQRAKVAVSVVGLLQGRARVAIPQIYGEILVCGDAALAVTRQLAMELKRAGIKAVVKDNTGWALRLPLPVIAGTEDSPSDCLVVNVVAPDAVLQPPTMGVLLSSSGLQPPSSRLCHAVAEMGKPIYIVSPNQLEIEDIEGTWLRFDPFAMRGEILPGLLRKR